MRALRTEGTWLDTDTIGKNYAFKKCDWFTLITGCFLGHMVQLYNFTNFFVQNMNLFFTLFFVVKNKNFVKSDLKTASCTGSIITPIRLLKLFILI